ncbi:hypothetical protein JJQ72_10530 [Paenibacillus sp. F411]|uniref:hypothetical protein n=1 Tax=Paenibacillus TaxID=44249 RepID=UPI0010FD16FF|nr:MULTISPECIES: hypothetical protein [Paenibacillus]MBO2944404.1 hypothetical protein [Paenibacillus sp. F411]
MKSTFKKVVGIASVAGLLFASANVYAATATATKPVNDTSTHESVSISGLGQYGTFATSVTAGTGTGYGKLYKFIRYWPDDLLYTHTVYYNGQPSQSTSYWLSSSEAYNVTASGDKSLGVTSSITN